MSNASNLLNIVKNAIASGNRVGITQYLQIAEACVHSEDKQKVRDLINGKIMERIMIC